MSLALVRRMEPGDAPAVEDMLRATRDGAYDPAFFAWKHTDNTFGASPSWVALVDGRVAAYRTFLRWEFEAPDGVLRAVRAVDTATHPEFQGRGLFTQVTLHAVRELTHEGVDLVFNTPNDKSRPGYLKMGWVDTGRLRAGFRPHSLWSLPRILRARGAADRSSEPVSAGVSAADVLADEVRLGRVLAAVPRADGWATRRSLAYLKWRYGFAPLLYRALLVDCVAGEGVLFFRLRRRGAARELVIADVLMPPGSEAHVRRALADALRSCRADYALGLQSAAPAGLWPLPGAGPRLVTRALACAGPWPLSGWSLSLGDIELF